MSRIGRNIVWLMISQLATWVVSLVTLLVIPDLLGDKDYGTFGFVVTYIAYFTLAAGLGTSTYLTREVARDHSVMGPYVYNAAVMKIVMVTGLSIAALGLGAVLGYSDDTLLLIGMGCVGMLFVVLNEIFTSALAGVERMAKPAMWGVVQVYFQSVAGILVLVIGWGLPAFVAVQSFSPLIPMVACGVLVWPYVRDHRQLDGAAWKLLFVGGVPLLVLTAFNLLYGTMDIPILYGISGEDTVGWYSLAYRWVGIPIFVSTAVVAAYFPSFSAHGVNVGQEFANLVNRAVKLVLLVTVPAAVGLAIVADELVSLFYDPEWRPTIPVMRVLAFHVPIAAVDTVLAMALIAANRLNKYLIVAGTAALLNPLVCVWAIHVTEDRYNNGAIGAAAVTLGTEVYILIGALLLKSSGVFDRATTRSAIAVMAASAVMAVPVILTDALPLLVRIAIGVVAYGAASIAFGSISVGDLRRAAQQAVQAVGGRRATTIVDPGSDHSASDTGAGDASDLGGDLHAEPGGQDRDRSGERVGE
jgi:O-antigen/teichoic acid export membrane protein